MSKSTLTEQQRVELRTSMSELNGLMTSIICVEVEMKADDRGDHGVSLESWPIKPNTAPLNMMVTEYKVGSFGAVYEREGYVEFEVGIHYHHQNRGSNGCHLCAPWSKVPIRLYYIFENPDVIGPFGGWTSVSPERR